jgi:hypothetical protein
MLASGFLFSLATGPTAFGVARTELPELTWTDEAAIRAALELDPGTNLFRLDTAPLEAALATLPAVASAEVSVALPDAVVVRVDERRPVLAWQVGERRYIADAGGAVFAILEAASPLPEGIALVDDRRTSGTAPLTIGGRLDAVDLDVATRLGSLVPDDLGSSAARLRVSVTDAEGYVVGVPDGWTAVFGFYSPATRPTDIIPGQVRLLRSLLAGRERNVREVILASETDGTYVPRTGPR